MSSSLVEKRVLLYRLFYRLSFRRLTLIEMLKWLRSVMARPQRVGRPAAPREPDSGGSEALFQFALAALSGGRETEAQRLLEEVVGRDPKQADAQFHLANILRARGQFEAAERHYRLTLLARETHAEAHANLGGLLKDRGDNEEAAYHFEQALQSKPDLAAASFNLAILRIDEGRWDDAKVLLVSSLSSDSTQADTLYWLGNALMREGDVVAARRSYKAALTLDGNFERARWGLAMAHLPAVPQSAGEQDAAVQDFTGELKEFRRWLATQKPSEAYRAVGAQQPYYVAYIPKNHRDALSEYGALCTELMAGWAAKVGVPPPSRAAGAKLKVGIVSAEIRNHSVWHGLVRGWVEFLDPKKFELHLFHTGQRDAASTWAEKHVHRLHEGIGEWTNWAKVISDGRFDLLLYPAIGMDATTVRLSALRLARTQLASWGHPITTGLPTMDGFISAAAFEPGNAAEHYTEPLHALPRLGCCYKPFGTPPKPADLAAWGIGPNDRILVCAGTPFKYAPRDDKVFVDIARRCGPCKIIFFRARPESLADLLEKRIRRAFEAAAVDFDDCVRFIPWQTQAEFFGLLDRADVFLDSIGFSGFNTAMQAVERATPIVAWDGEFMRGRFASGILREAGLGEWVASSHEDYVEKAERLCADRSLRDRVRAQMKERQSALFDDRESVRALADFMAGCS